MCKALMTGHDGSMTTIHAEDGLAIDQAVQYVMENPRFAGNERLARRIVEQVVHVVVHIANQDGRRRVTGIVAVERGGNHKWVYRQVDSGDLFAPPTSSAIDALRPPRAAAGRRGPRAMTIAGGSGADPPDGRYRRHRGVRVRRERIDPGNRRTDAESSIAITSFPRTREGRCRRSRLAMAHVGRDACSRHERRDRGRRDHPDPVAHGAPGGGRLLRGPICGRRTGGAASLAHGAGIPGAASCAS